MYDHWSAGDTADASYPPPNSDPPQIGFADPIVGQTSDYIFFVHGWRMKPWERRAFAETAFKRLWHLGYKGGFALYSWPTEYTPNPLFDLGNYDRSELKAWQSAAGLMNVLEYVNLSMKHAGHVYIFAHSMGNIVTSEALRLEAGSYLPTRLVHTYIASQASSVANAYDQSVPAPNVHTPQPDVYGHYPLTGKPYFFGTLDFSRTGGLLRAADKLVNYYNEVDYALSNWLVNQNGLFGQGEKTVGNRTKDGPTRVVV